MSTYSIADHAHRFAVWAAGRAYSRSGGDRSAKALLARFSTRSFRKTFSMPKLWEVPG